MQYLLALAPFITLGILFAFSWRVGSLIGHWPRPSLDDPKFSAPGDLLSDLLYVAVPVSLMVSFAALVLLPLLTMVLWGKVPRRRSLTLLALYIAGMVLLRLDPGNRFTWYMD